MNIVYTEQAISSFEKSLNFLAKKVSYKKLSEIRDEVLDAAESLAFNPHKGQEEPFLIHLSLGHRRIVVGHYKIIYRVKGKNIYITDIFDSRQAPDKIKP